MRLEYYPVDKLKREVLDIVDKYPELKDYQIFFFGSRVSGTAGERSDIDIGIIGPRPIPAKLLADIEEEIGEIPTLYKIEIVDFSSVSEKFCKVALKKWNS